MYLSTFLVSVALCSTVYCQTKLNLTSLEGVFAQFPNCTTVCAAEVLKVAECSATNRQDCLCSNTTIQYRITACVLEACTFEEQILTTNINQKELCVGYPVPSRSNALVRDIVIIAIFAYSMVILRFTSRILIARKLWWDDFFIVIALLGMLPSTTILSYLAYHGFGTHYWDVLSQDFYILNLAFYICESFYVTTQSAAKFSILFLYIRIFPTPRFRLITKIFIGFMIGHTISFMFAVTLQCVPVKAIWDLTLDKKCVDQNAMIHAGAGLSIFEDFFIMLMPIWVLKDLQMSLKKKIELFFIFAIGSFACVTSMIRVKKIVTFGKSIDRTWEYMPVILWSMIEAYTAVICACLMTIRPLLVRIFPFIFQSTKTDPNSDLPSNSNSPNPNAPRSQTWNRKAHDRFRGRERLDDTEDGTYLSSLTGNTFLTSGRNSILSVDDNGDRVGKLMPDIARSVSPSLYSRSNTSESDEIPLTAPWNEKGVGMGMEGIKGSTIVSDMNDREISRD